MNKKYYIKRIKELEFKLNITKWFIGVVTLLGIIYAIIYL